jgi:hypothetical protein
VSPLVARAQKNLPLVAVLVPGTAKLANDRIVAIRKGMREAGLTEGVDYAFALRFADGMLDLLPGLALELGALNPRVIVASAAAAPVAHKALPEFPLVFTSYAADPRSYVILSVVSTTSKVRWRRAYRMTSPAGATDRPRRGGPRYPLHAQARPLPVHSSSQCCASL